jgi:hypothetical protein
VASENQTQIAQISQVDKEQAKTRSTLYAGIYDNE